MKFAIAWYNLKTKTWAFWSWQSLWREGQHALLFDTQEKAERFGEKFFQMKYQVVEFPEAAMAKFKEAHDLLCSCDAQPQADVPSGSTQNRLFYRGHEIMALRAEGERLLQLSIPAPT
jgi:hypothetical protein